MYLRVSPSILGKIIVLSLAATVFQHEEESPSRLLHVRLFAKWVVEVVLFSYAWVCKNNINMSTDNICLYIDDSASSETTCDYTGLEGLEEGPRLLNLKGIQRSEGVRHMKYNQKRQPEKAQHMRCPFLKIRIIWSQKGGLQVFKKIWQVASPLDVLSACCNCNVGIVFSFCQTFPF